MASSSLSLFGRMQFVNKTRNSALTPNSRALRRNMTPEERRLWYEFLKLLPQTVHRQKVIGPYIADFYIASSNLIIELDGSQHYEPSGLAKDAERDACFRDNGITVLRYTNLDIKQRFPHVCEDILHHMQQT